MGEVWAIVPARAGSKGVLDKNIKPLAGHPLLGWSVRAGLLARNIDRVVISTDSPIYADIARSYGGEAPFLRPSDLASDSSPDFGFMSHAIEWFLAHEGRAPDYWVHLRPTTPLREVSVIERAVETFRASGQSTALRSVHQMPESAYKCLEIADGLLKQVGTGNMALDAANAARQSFPQTYAANGYVDILRTQLVRERRLLHGDRVQAHVTPVVTEVDAVEDFAYLEYQAARRPDVARALFG